jgi:ATP:corrinoid adenosyltransferase
MSSKYIGNTREYFVEKIIELAQAEQKQAEQKQLKQKQLKQAQAQQAQAQQAQVEKDEEHAKMLAEFENSVEKAKKEKLILDEAEYKLKYKLKY